ncbi:hypothetical protein QFC19_001663 [Naganishia cerealis]|uniref:Uncharacterized protein n=1 Tax=Naganishia cerealis TaxID=610337 RepID=A0ACC2WES7_9TREE|nr:hypothetical protein QFC19_001663 [Naganishia cerealis]
MTRRPLSLPASPAHHQTTERLMIKALDQLQRHHSSSSKTHSVAGIGWGGTGILGIACSELEELKRKRRQEQALAKRIKQSRRGEIDSWDVEAGTSATYWSGAAPGIDPSTNDSATGDGVWPCWNSASTPVSDEEWGEDGDYGGDAFDFSELMVADPTQEQCWSDQPSSEVITTIIDHLECHGSPVPLQNTGTDSTAADTTVNDTSMAEAGACHTNPSPMSMSVGSPLPPSSKQVMITPISPTLSSQVPSSVLEEIHAVIKLPDENLHLSLPTFGLNNPRKRQQPDATTADEVQETLPKEYNHKDRDMELTLHMNKKPFVRSCRI